MTRLFALIGLFVVMCWAMASLGIGNFVFMMTKDRYECVKQEKQ